MLITQMKYKEQKFQYISFESIFITPVFIVCSSFTCQILMYLVFLLNRRPLVREEKILKNASNFDSSLIIKSHMRQNFRHATYVQCRIKSIKAPELASTAARVCVKGRWAISAMSMGTNTSMSCSCRSVF